MTFLFTDIAGSTRRWDTNSAAMTRVFARHDALALFINGFPLEGALAVGSGDDGSDPRYRLLESTRACVCLVVDGAAPTAEAVVFEAIGKP